MKIHVVLKEKDAHIIAFKKALPHGKFNETVIKILRNAIQGEELKEPISFEVDWCAPEVHTKIDLPDDLVKQLRDKFKLKKGNFTPGIKWLIRRHIHSNWQRVSHPCLDIALVMSDYKNFIEEVKEIKTLFDNDPDKYKKRLHRYTKVLEKLTKLYSDREEEKYD